MASVLATTFFSLSEFMPWLPLQMDCRARLKTEINPFLSKRRFFMAFYYSNRISNLDIPIGHRIKAHHWSVSQSTNFNIWSTGILFFDFLLSQELHMHGFWWLSTNQILNTPFRAFSRWLLAKKPTLTPGCILLFNWAPLKPVVKPLLKFPKQLWLCFKVSVFYPFPLRIKKVGKETVNPKQ